MFFLSEYMRKNYIQVKTAAMCMTNIVVYLARANLGNVARKREEDKNILINIVICH